MSKHVFMTPSRLDANGTKVGGELIERTAEHEQPHDLYMTPARVANDGSLTHGEVFGIDPKALARNSAETEPQFMPATPYYEGHEIKDHQWVRSENDSTAAPGLGMPGRLTAGEQTAL